MSNRTTSVGLKISKAIVLGDLGVGKTSLVHRFCHEEFDTDYRGTIGVEFQVERFDILQVPFNLHIWDTAGQDRFRSIAASYYRRAHAVIIVFNVTESMSLGNSERWLNDALEVCDGHPHIFLVGTQTDMCSEATYRMVEQQAAAVASALKAEYWAVSSETGDNVQNVFFRVASLAFNAGVLKELDVISPSQQIGNNLIITRDKSDLYEQKHRSCC